MLHNLTKSLADLVDEVLAKIHSYKSFNFEGYARMYSTVMADQSIKNPRIYLDFIDSKSIHPFTKFKLSINQLLAQRVNYITKHQEENFKTNLTCQEIDEMQKPLKILEHLNVIKKVEEGEGFQKMRHNECEGFQKFGPFLVLDFGNEQILNDVWFCAMLYQPYLN